MVLALCALFSSPAFAQEATEPAGKPNVFIDYFKRSSDVPFVWVEGLRNHVIEGIHKLDRVQLIDVDSKDVLRIEKERRESEDISAGDDNDMNRLAVMQQEGANFLIQGTVSSMTANREKMDDGSIYYSASIAYTLKLVDPKTGKLVGTKSFQHGGAITDVATGSTPDEAIADASAKAVKAVREFIDENFKVQGTILEISEVKKDKAKKVYISLGSDNGVSEGTYFAVFVLRKVAGRDSRKEIGRLAVETVEGGDLSLCDVKKGDKEIKQAMDAGQDIIIELIPKPKSFLDKAAGAVNSL